LVTIGFPFLGYNIYYTKSSKEQEIRRTKNKQTHKNGEQKFKLAGSKNLDI